MGSDILNLRASGLGAALSLFFMIGSGSTEAQTLESARDGYVRSLEALRSKEAAIDTVKRSLSNASNEISKFKTSGQPAGFIQKYKLQNRLQDAQLLSDQLSKLQKERQDLINDFFPKQRLFLEKLDAEIESLRSFMLSPKPALASRQTSALALSKLLAERHEAVLLHHTRLSELPQILPAVSDDRQDLKEQLLALDDLENALLVQVKSLTTELALAERQKFLQRELSQLFDEEAFFGEQGFITLGVSGPKVNAQKINPTPSSGTSSGTETSLPQVAATSEGTAIMVSAESSTLPAAPSNAPASHAIPATSAPSTSTSGALNAASQNPAPKQTTTTTLTSDVPMKSPVDSGVQKSPPQGLTMISKHPEAKSAIANPKQTPSSVQNTATDERELTRYEKAEKRSRPFSETSLLDKQIDALSQQMSQIKSLLGDIKKSKKDIRMILHP